MAFYSEKEKIPASQKMLNLPYFSKFSSFTYLNVTQFLGALNDNIFKLLIVYFLLQTEGMEHSHHFLALSGAIFVAPFLLFSSYSGVLADRFSKRNIIILTKALELIVMGCGIVAFALASKWGSYGVLFLMALQSAVFGPSKYGIVPELVDTEKLSGANGLMTSFTFLAVILGTFLASFTLDVTGKDFILAASFCAAISLVGLLTSLCIEYTPPSDGEKELKIRPITQTKSTMEIIREDPSLTTAVFGSAFFFFICAYVQLNMIPYAVDSLYLSETQGGYLFLLTAVGIGLGSIISGKISGKLAELALVPIALLGMVGCLYGMDTLATQSIFYVLPVIFLAGFFGGIYQIPLDSYIQYKSPAHVRGQIVATTSFVSFVGVLFASILMFLINETIGFSAEKGFAIIGSITIIVGIPIAYQYFDYLTRFIAMILSKIHFKSTVQGLENLPATPVIFFCHHTAWNDTLLLLGSQRNRIRFFIDEEQDHSKWMKRLYRLLRVVQIPPIEMFEDNHECDEAIFKSLKRGLSVCILVGDPNVTARMEVFCSSHKSLENYPVILAEIEKGEKEMNASHFTRLLNKCRVPAAITYALVFSEA